MSKALITESYLTDIANAIRTKSGTTSLFLPPNMAQAIKSISGGANILSGTADPTADLGVDGQIYLKYKGPSPGAQEFSFFTQGDTPYYIADTESYRLRLTNYESSPDAQFIAFCYGTNRAVVVTEDSALLNAKPFWFCMRDGSGVPLSAQSSSTGLVYADYETYVLGYHPPFTTYYVPNFSSRNEGLSAVRDFLDNGKILAVYLKVDGVWQALIGSDIDDVDTKGGSIRVAADADYNLAGVISQGGMNWVVTAEEEVV